MSKVLTDNKHYTDIAAAIREKNGTDDKYKPAEMADAIAAIETGGGGGDLPEEAFLITGDCKYRFANNAWNWFIDKYGNKVQTSDITALDNLFLFSSKLTTIPFEINCKTDMNYTLSSVFYDCQKLVEIPKIKNCKVNRMDSMFFGCYNVRYFPDDIADWFDWSYIESMTVSYSGNANNLFANCYSMRKFPIGMIEHQNPAITYSYSVYNRMIAYCYSLDEIVGIPVYYQTQYTLTSDVFSNTFRNTNRLKELTFKTDEDGYALKAQWKNQKIDLTYYVGYSHELNRITGHNSGITADKRVKDDATYQALKNDADWFSTLKEYSRYNRTSAVNTINSLPDTSEYLSTAGGTNTITFLGASGSLTDGGAINTMTEEEIAVATAKGWTVTFS